MGKSEGFSRSSEVFSELEFGFFEDIVIAVIAKYEAIKSVNRILFLSLVCHVAIAPRNVGNLFLESF